MLTILEKLLFNTNWGEAQLSFETNKSKLDFNSTKTLQRNAHFVLRPSIVSLISSELMWPFSVSCPPRSFTTPTRFSLAFNSCEQ